MRTFERPLITIFKAFKRACLGIFIFMFAAASLTSAKPATNREEAAKKIDQLSHWFHHTYKNDESATSTIQKAITSIADANQMMADAKDDAAFRIDLEKFRETSFRKIQELGDRAIPFLIQEYLATYHDKFTPREKISFQMRASMDRTVNSRLNALNDAFSSVGVKAIPSLSELQSRAAKLDASGLADNLKVIITKIVKASDRNQTVDFTASSAAKPEQQPDQAQPATIPALPQTEDGKDLSIPDGK